MFRFNTVIDDSPEFLEVAAAGYEAMDAQREYMRAKDVGMIEGRDFARILDLRNYRDAAELVFNVEAVVWRAFKDL